MTATTEKIHASEALSERVSREFPAAVWRRLFVEKAERPRLQAGSWTALCAEGPWDGWMRPEAVRALLASLAPRHGGFLDAGTGSAALAVFADAASALRAAMALQRLATGARLRVALATGEGAVAQFQLEGAAAKLLLGATVGRARALTQRAAAGTVQLCACSYDELAGHSSELDACVVMAELEQDQVTEVALTLPPARGEELSTFAGLGLV